MSCRSETTSPEIRERSSKKKLRRGGGGLFVPGGQLGTARRVAAVAIEGARLGAASAARVAGLVIEGVRRHGFSQYPHRDVPALRFEWKFLATIQLRDAPQWSERAVIVP